MTTLPVRRQASVARSPVPLVVACCALLTALAMLQIGGAAMALRPGATSAADDPTANATRAAVNRFYAAVNVALATGDAAPLDSAVDPAFVGHVAASNQPRDRIALVADLLARRRADPDLQYAVAAVVVDGDQALAYVQTDPNETIAAPPNPTIEALRVRDGMVIARWS
ncbi:MAG TPA: nuclear transport factor 2 family protein, partial [Thermomicrobiales bacterium]|nr:nuclear transport factor 2 family protein [Thermomicrobiales bacterium]